MVSISLEEKLQNFRTAKANLDTIHELEALLKEVQIDSVAAEINFLLGKIYHILQNQQEAIRFYETCLKFASYENEDEIKGKAYSNLGTIYFHKGDMAIAKEYYEHALVAKKRSTIQSNVASTYLNLGNVCLKQEEYVEALSYYEKAYTLFSQIQDNAGLVRCLYNQGIIYFFNENFDKALELYIDALSSVSPITDPELTIQIHTNLGDTYISLEKYGVAEKHLKKSLELSKNNGFEQGIIFSYVLLGDMYLKEQKFDLARQYSEDGLAIDGNNYHEMHCWAHLTLGSIYLIKKENELANFHLTKSLEMAATFKLKKIMRDILPQLIQYYKSYSDYKSALYYLEKLQNLKDEYSLKRMDTKLAELRYFEEKERIEKENQWREQKNDELEKEKKRSDTLLKNILPDDVAEELKMNGSSKAVYYEDVTVLFTDFHEFSSISKLLDATALVDELHTCFKAFDEIIGKYSIEKIKTVGDAYIAASGIPAANPNHASDIVSAAQEIRTFMKERKKQFPNTSFNIRIGIHSGPVVAGIVGVKKFAYDIWGDTVNIAARLEQNAQINQILISETTFLKLKDTILFINIGNIDAKNIGHINVYSTT